MKKSYLFYAISILLILFFTTAVFYRLGRFTLWQDEAETALLGKSIIKNGLPYAYFDGKWVTQWDSAQESNEDHLWNITPWLPFYIAAFGYKLFGSSDMAARAPFAASGVLSAILLLFLALRWTKSRGVALLTLFFYVTNMTVIIYTRQCKYPPVYFLAYIMVLLGIITYQEKGKGTVLTILGFAILFYCNYLAAGLAFAGFAAYSLFFREGRKCLPLFWKTCLGVAILFGPFMFLDSLGNRTARHLGAPSLLLSLEKFGRHIYYWNGQAFPLLLALLFIWRRPPYFRLFATAILSSWLILPFLSKDVLRYDLQLMPLFCLALGFLVVSLFRKNRLAGAALFSILFFTNLFQNMPDAIYSKSLKPLFYRSDWTALKNYYFKGYTDPVKVIPEMVKSRSKGTEYVYLNHDQLVWQLYSDIPYAYLAERSKLRHKNTPVADHWLDRSAIDWWIGPHFVRQGYSFYISQEEMLEEWKKAGYRYEVIDTGIPLMNWDLASPIRYKHFIDKFSDNPSIKETILLVHRLKK